MPVFKKFLKGNIKIGLCGFAFVVCLKSHVIVILRTSTFINVDINTILHDYILRNNDLSRRSTFLFVVYCCFYRRHCYVNDMYFWNKEVIQCQHLFPIFQSFNTLMFLK